MNKNEILKSLKDYTLASVILEDQDYSQVSLQISDDSEHTILFLKPTLKLKEMIKDKNLKSLIISTEDLGQKNQIVLAEKNWLKGQKNICDHFFPIKSETKIIGITGTNGKTSTAYYLMQLLSQNGVKAASVGTLGLRNDTGELIKDFSLTTPSYIEVRKILSSFYGEFDFYIFEVSSHALEQKRFFEISFDQAGWTSFSQDHLDYHKTMDAYFQSKLKIFDFLKNGSKLFISEREGDLYKKIKNLKKNIEKVQSDTFLENPIFEANFNKANFDVAQGILKGLIKSPLIDETKIEPPPGRFQVIEKNDYKIIIDFAHSPDALDNITRAIKESTDKKLLTIFGCGGDRDPLKRALMAKVAQKNSDYIIVTSDNPRFESPEKIIRDIEKGFSESNYKIVLDRKEAIEFAMKNFKHYIILVAGKGHEAYLDIKGVKIPYSDKEEVNRWIND